MRSPWFKRIGLFFIPRHIIGWLILLAGLGCAVYAFISIDGRSHSVSDTLRPFSITLLIIGVAYYLVAFLASRQVET